MRSAERVTCEETKRCLRRMTVFSMEGVMAVAEASNFDRNNLNSFRVVLFGVV